MVTVSLAEWPFLKPGPGGKPVGRQRARNWGLTASTSTSRNETGASGAALAVVKTTEAPDKDLGRFGFLFPFVSVLLYNFKECPGLNKVQSWCNSDTVTVTGGRWRRSLRRDQREVQVDRCTFLVF